MKSLLSFGGIFAKDLRLLFWSSGSVFISIIFSLGLFTLFRFSVIRDEYPKSLALWMTYFLSILFILIQSQEWEQKNKAYRLLILSGIDLNVVFFSKAAAAVCAIFSLWLIEVLIWGVFFDVFVVLTTADLYDFTYKMALVGVLSAAAFGISGTQASALAVHSGFPLVMLFIIFLPLNLPVLIACSQLIMETLGEVRNIDPSSLIFLLLAFSMLYTATGILLYDKLLEE